MRCSLKAKSTCLIGGVVESMISLTMNEEDIVERRCFTVCLENSPILFIHNSIVFEAAILSEPPVKSYEGKFFYYTDTSDVYGCLHYTKKLGYKLNLMFDKKLVLSLAIDTDRLYRSLLTRNTISMYIFVNFIIS